MTNFVVRIGYDMNQAEIGLPGGNWLASDLTSTLAHYYDDVFNHEDYSGSNLVYDAFDNFVSGTVTSYANTEDGKQWISLSDTVIDAGTLHDLLQANDAAGLFDVILSGNDILRGSIEADSLYARLGNDQLYGNAGNDTLKGEGGADRIYGGNGRDTLIGGSGNDRLDGEKGNDTLIGGTSADSFIFSTVLGTNNVDAIQDFRVVDDTILLTGTVFSGSGPAGTTLTANRFYNGVAAHDASDRIIYDGDSGKLYYDADGNAAGGVVAVHFATLSVGLALSELDFKII